MRSNQKPILFHASPQPLEGDFIQPMPNHTCAWSEFRNEPELAAQHTGDFVFAGAGVGGAYAYALKLANPDRPEYNVRPYCYMANVSAMGEGVDKIVCTTIADKDEYLALLKHRQPMIYQMPTEIALKQFWIEMASQQVNLYHASRFHLINASK